MEHIDETTHKGAVDDVKVMGILGEWKEWRSIFQNALSAVKSGYSPTEICTTIPRMVRYRKCLDQMAIDCKQSNSDDVTVGTFRAMAAEISKDMNCVVEWGSWAECAGFTKNNCNGSDTSRRDVSIIKCNGNGGNRKEWVRSHGQSDLMSPTEFRDTDILYRGFKPAMSLRFKRLVHPTVDSMTFPVTRSTGSNLCTSDRLFMTAVRRALRKHGFRVKNCKKI
jgi:hypothetical protein